MTTGISRDLVSAYFQACVSCEAARIAPYLDDDVDWSCAGPIDLLLFCGQKRGKAVVLDTLARLAPSVIKPVEMNIDEIVIDGDRAATFMRLSAIHVPSDRRVSYRCAQYLRFRDGKLVEFRSLIDSFDAAEQVLGHPIKVAPPQKHGHGHNVVMI